MPELSYQPLFNPGFEGAQFDSTNLHDRVSRINADTVVIPMGRFVKKDATEKGILTMSTSTDLVEGIVYYEPFGELDKTVTTA